MIWTTIESKHPVKDPELVQVSNQVANQQVTNQKVTFKQRFKSICDLKKFKSELESTPGLTRKYVLLYGMFFIISITLPDDAFTEKIVRDVVLVNGTNSMNRMDSMNRASVTKWKVVIPSLILLAAVVATSVVTIFGKCYNQHQSQKWFIMQMILHMVKIISAVFITDKTFNLSWQWFILYINYFFFHVTITIDVACAYHFLRREESPGIEISKRTIFSVIWWPLFMLFCLLLFGGS